jgi:hypothetical protein
LGYGYLNTAAAVAAARRIGTEKLGAPAPTASMPRHVEIEVAAEDVAFAPIWVDDAAAGVEMDETAMNESSIVLREVATTTPPPAIRDCGCGGHRVTHADATVAREQLDRRGGHDAAFEALDAEDEIGAPVLWEDVQEALEALNEVEG